jgi:uncharacterized protein YdaU (DUF1376 family)
LSDFPSFPFNVNDFLFDEVVDAMSAEEVGAYIRLLCRAWNQKPAGTIPDDDSTLARWSHLSPDRWTACRPAVLAAFTAPSNGRMTQKRMAAEYRKMTEARRVRSSAGRMGAKKKWQCYSNAMAPPEQCHSQTDDAIHPIPIHPDTEQTLCTPSNPRDVRANGNGGKQSARPDLDGADGPSRESADRTRKYLKAMALLAKVPIAPGNLSAAQTRLGQLPEPLAVMNRLLEYCKDQGFTGDRQAGYVVNGLAKEVKALKK